MKPPIKAPDETADAGSTFDPGKPSGFDSRGRSMTSKRIFEAREQRYGGWLEDYQVGDEYRHWPGKTITDAENHLFCLLTMAASPLHVDDVYSARHGGPFKRTVVVGSYVYSLLLGMSVADISGRALANLGTTDLRHTSPIYPGDTLYGASTVLEVRPSRSRPDAGILTVRTVGRNQDGVEVAGFVRSVMLPRQGTGEKTPENA